MPFQHVIEHVANGVALIDIGGHYQAPGRQHVIENRHELLANPVWQIIEQSGAVKVIVLLPVLPATGGAAQKLRHRFLDEAQAGAALVALLALLEDARGVIQRLLVEVQQSELRVIGQRAGGEESLHFARRPAAQVEDADGPLLGADAHGFFDQPAGQQLDAIAVRFGRRLGDKPDVEQFGVERTALLRIAQDHVHHLVVPGIPQRLGERPPGERGAQHQRMKLLLQEAMMRRRQIGRRARGAS